MSIKKVRILPSFLYKIMRKIKQFEYIQLINSAHKDGLFDVVLQNCKTSDFDKYFEEEKKKEQEDSVNEYHNYGRLATIKLDKQICHYKTQKFNNMIKKSINDCFKRYDINKAVK